MITKQGVLAFSAGALCLLTISWTAYRTNEIESRLTGLEKQQQDQQQVGKRAVSSNRGDQDIPLNPALSRAGGAVYTRWGRTTCPPDNELVYAGSVAGSWYDHTGGAPNYLCMPRDPQWGKYTDSASGAAYLYGGEYEAIHVVGAINHNPPCSVCRVANRSSTFMLPGRMTCHAGWQTEYFGYLVSSHYGHKHGNDYICLDDEPEADPSGFRDENSILMYKVEAQCGSLPCPEYINNREITCAVCTK